MKKRIRYDNNHRLYEFFIFDIPSIAYSLFLPVHSMMTNTITIMAISNAFLLPEKKGIVNNDGEKISLIMLIE